MKGYIKKKRVKRKPWGESTICLPVIIRALKIVLHPSLYGESRNKKEASAGRHISCSLKITKHHVNLVVLDNRDRI
jgi:hypothetical protein